MTQAALVGLRCRTADRTVSACQGAEALATLLGRRLGTEPRLVGSFEGARAQRFDADLADSRGCLLEAGGQVDDALVAGALPILCAGDCSVAVSTLPTIARLRPEARVLWLDAHGDFNTPDTSGSGYLGGMALAGACGLWETGFEGWLPGDRLVLAGVRDLDPGERELLERSPATVLGVSEEDLAAVPEALAGAPVFVHLDLDVLDPTVFPATQVPSAGGLSAKALRDLLGDVAWASEVVGLEITAFAAPDDPDGEARLAELAAGVVEPLLPAEGDGDR